MHDIRSIRENPDAFDSGLRSRGLDPLSGELIRLDEARRAAIGALQAAQERRNALSKEIGAAKKAKDEARATALQAEVAALKDGTPALERAERDAVAALDARLAEIPNTPNPEVPEGRDETGNKPHGEPWGTKPTLENPKQHFELGEAWRGGGGTLMDFDAAAKLSGSRFVVLRGQLARLERALGQFMLDLHTGEHGYTEVSPPLMVRDDAMFGTAQLPKFRDDQFAATTTLSEDEIDKAVSMWTAVSDFPELRAGLAEMEAELVEEVVSLIASIRPERAQGIGSDLESVLDRLRVNENAFIQLKQQYIAARTQSSNHWLIPTAEVPLTNLVRESILSEGELPLRFTALTPCFRAEAGAAGRDTRGMLRQHQFTKCELVSITTPEQSAAEHERMLGCAEAVLQRLDLPYRVMTLCTGDMGFASKKTWDIEVWMPGQATFREISSCSVCGDFQARRMNARVRPTPGSSPGAGKGTRFVHTLNGSGVAVGRALIAVLENYQQPDGSVIVPDALKPYMGGVERIGSSA